jgi:hypothetical protein
MVGGSARSKRKGFYARRESDVVGQREMGGRCGSESQVSEINADLGWRPPPGLPT